MAGYPRPNKSPFFKSFASPPRVGNVVQREYTLPPEIQKMMASPQITHKASNRPKLAPMPPSPPVSQAPPSLPPIPVPPEDAAERFQQINTGLPDGVRFEPLDDETRKALKNLGMAPDKPPAPQPPSPQPTSSPIPPIFPETPPLKQDQPVNKSAELLQQLIQDERNAAVYYQQLSALASAGNFKETLESTAKDSQKRCNKYQQILEKLHGTTFNPEETEINLKIGFEQGVEIAFAEERKILNAMLKLIDQLV